MSDSLRPAVFVDRDGTLNEMVYDEVHGVLDSPFSPEQLVLKQHAVEFVRRINELGMPCLVVTNQPGISKGTLTAASLERIHARLREQLAAGGARLDGIFHCPHHPEFGPLCHCRKPKPGLLQRAAAIHRAELSGSFMVGDGLNDMEAGNALGLTTILVARQKPEILERLGERPGERPRHFARDLQQALAIIEGQRSQAAPSGVTS
jgi:D-glycero-D-manno-heptose 1,7-bisphosphate phosphatase